MSISIHLNASVLIFKTISFICVLISNSMCNFDSAVLYLVLFLAFCLWVTGSDGSVKAPAVEIGTTSEEKQLYEPAPLSPFSIEEGGSIKAPTVDTGTTSKEKQLYEPASLPFPTEGNDSMKAPVVEGGTTSEEKQLYEPVPLPFPWEGGDFIKAPAVEAGTTLKETQLTEHAPSQRRKVKYLLIHYYFNK